MKPVIAIVIPCYNEEEALPISSQRILDLLSELEAKGEISPDSFLLCVNDGSKDQTWELIKDLHAQNPKIKGISLAHNRGHQFALLAGLMTAKDMADAVISIDADLQDDPAVMADMIAKFKEGHNIVYGVRSSRDTDTAGKRISAHMFYSLQRQMGLETIFDHADYRLMDRKALDLLSQYPERNLFLRGIIPSIGLRHTCVYYRRDKRVAGESKYPFSKMLSFSVDGITSFSTKPIQMVMYVGLVMVLISILMGIYVLVSYLSGNIVAGWSSIMLSLWFIGGLMLTAIGIVGTYIGKIYIEVKQRPRYSIGEYLL